MDKLEAVVTPTSPIDPPPAYQAHVRTRLVICVDGTKHDSNPNIGQSNIDRIFTGIRNGQCVENGSGEAIYQVPKYIPAIAGGTPDDVLSNRLHAAFPGQSYQQQIQDVYEQCCTLTGDDDEVVLFGFSRGAYVVRAVAGLLHHYGALAGAGKQGFAKNYKKLVKQTLHVDNGFLQPGLGLDLSRAASVSSASTALSGSALSADLRAGPKIKFVGVFDTVNPLTDSSAFDISFNFSIQHLRHAVALHEEKRALTPETIYPEELRTTQLRDEGRSMIQAWFVGNHNDIGGASPKAGLALYPLQWMVVEAVSCGVGFDLSRSDKPLSVAFPRLGGDGKPVKRVSFKGSNQLEVIMQDLKYVHDQTEFQGIYSIKLNNGRSASVRMKKQRSPFDRDGCLRGYCDQAPQGTIIHPSVYLLLDEHINLALDTKEAKLQRDIEDYREKMLGTKDGKLNVGFWGKNALEEDDPPDPGAIRVLVCGNTGVGKSTLINKTFGVDVTQSSDRARGIHDVKQEIIWEGRQDLVVHDSGGFEAGADDEFKAIEEFLKDKSAALDVEDRLHVIWFCIDINSARTLQTATEKLFQAVSTYASEVPIIVVATKKDDLLDMEFSKRRKEFKKLKQPLDEEACEEYAEEQLKKRLSQIREEMESVPGGRLDALVAVSHEDEESISELSKTTSLCLDTDKVRALYIRAQVTRIDLKVDLACAEVLRRYKSLVRTATGVSFTFIGPTAHSKSAAHKVCKAILNCFGLPSVSADTALEAMKETVWNHLGFDITLAISECLNTLGYVSTGLIAGAPMWAVAGLFSAPMVVPATCRLFLTMACDLILVLARSFKEVAFSTTGHPRERHVQAAARLYRLKGYSEHVHRDVKQLIPRRNMFTCYKFNKVQRGVDTMIETYKDGLMEDVELPDIDKRSDNSARRRGSAGADSDDIDDDSTDTGSAFYKEIEETNRKIAELDVTERTRLVELAASSRRAELESTSPALAELDAANAIPTRAEILVRGFY